MSHYLMGFCWASDDVYLLQEVVQVSASNHTCSSLPLPPPPPLGWPWWVHYRSWWVSRMSFSVWRRLVVVAGLCVAVDTCTLCSRLAFRLTQPPAITDTFPELIYWQWVKLWTMSSFLSTKLLTGTILTLKYYNTTFNRKQCRVNQSWLWIIDGKISW